MWPYFYLDYNAETATRHTPITHHTQTRPPLGRSKYRNSVCTLVAAVRSPRDRGPAGGARREVHAQTSKRHTTMIHGSCKLCFVRRERFRSRGGHKTQENILGSCPVRCCRLCGWLGIAAFPRCLHTRACGKMNTSATQPPLILLGSLTPRRF